MVILLLVLREDTVTKQLSYHVIFLSLILQLSFSFTSPSYTAPSNAPVFGNWSETWWLSTKGGNGPPATFSKTSPANNTMTQSTSPMLSWNTGTGAVSYEYCYDTNNNSACDNSWISTGSDTSISLSGLSLNTPYYWQVRVVNAEGTTYADDGTWWLFTTYSIIRWTGTTNWGKQMGFSVNAFGTQWIDFSLIINYIVTTCVDFPWIPEFTISTEVGVIGPGNISSNQFSYTSSMISFTGQFNTTNTASGTYSLNNYPGVIHIPSFILLLLPYNPGWDMVGWRAPRRIWQIHACQ